MDTHAPATPGDYTPTPDKLIRFEDVPAIPWLPRRRGGRKLSKSTPWRWWDRGVGGIHLRAVRVGGTLCTTETWLREYFETLAGTRPGQHDATVRTPSRRQREIAATQRRLRKEGL